MLKSLRCFLAGFFLLGFVGTSLSVSAQNNSPYSRYGLGDAVPPTNIVNRAMGGISAAYTDPFSINFNNPASYSQFQASIEQRSKKVSGGRVILDVGMNFDNRTLVAPNTTGRFTSSDAFFSYLQLGVPIRRNWGLSFGLRPLTRIGYMINRDEYLMNPLNPNDTIDRAITQFRGSGGSFLPSIGTGFAIGNFSFGANMGYLFGNRENETLRSLLNDSVLYYSSDHNTKYSFGGLYFDAGIMFTKKFGTTTLRLGASGNWEQTIKGSQDVLRQTFTRGTSGEILQLDSVFQQKDVRGNLIYPASYKVGFTLQQFHTNNSGWLLGADISQSKWSNYRFFGQKDSVQDNWQLSVGGQFYPRPKMNYFSNVIYRAGFFAGPDYIRFGQKLPTFGGSFGLGLPIRPRTAMTRNQYHYLNLAFEYGKRGNNDNLLKENMFRVSVSFNLNDIWFGKQRYE